MTQFEIVENWLLENIAKSIKNANYESANWKKQRLDEIIKINNGMSKKVKEFMKTYEKEFLEIQKIAIADAIPFNFEMLEKAKEINAIKNIPKQIISDASKKIIQKSVKTSFKDIKKIGNASLNKSKKMVVQYLDIAKTAVSSGIDVKDAVKKSCSELAEKGITIIKDNKNYQVDSIIRERTRENLYKVNEDISKEFAKEINAEYYIVSSHANSRPEHANWQGKVFKIKGEDENYKNFAKETGYGTKEGLGGHGCRHRFSVFFPNIQKNTMQKYDKKESDELYKKEQKQRYNERQIRAQKRKVSVLSGSNDSSLVTEFEKLKNMQKRQKLFIKDNNLRRQSDRESVYE